MFKTRSVRISALCIKYNVQYMLRVFYISNIYIDVVDQSFTCRTSNMFQGRDSNVADARSDGPRSLRNALHRQYTYIIYPSNVARREKRKLNKWPAVFRHSLVRPTCHEFRIESRQTPSGQQRKKARTYIWSNCFIFVFFVSFCVYCWPPTTFPFVATSSTPAALTNAKRHTETHPNASQHHE